MKLDQLQYFIETAKRQHIGQAANFLNISPSAISHSISALEEELGKSLFVKQGRRIKLTTHGKILLDRAEFILSEVNNLRDELSSEQVKMKGHYRLAATHVICSEFLTPLWLEMQKEHLDLTATLYSLRSGEVLSRVNANEVDLGFCLSPHSDPNHEQEIIHRGQLVFSFGKKHPFLKKKQLKEIELYPSIAAQATQGIENCENLPDFRKLNIRPKVVNLFDSYDVAIRAVKSNAVWALLPDFLAYSHHNAIETFIPEGFDAKYTVAAIWPKYHIRTPALDCMIKKMKKFIKQTLL